MYLSHIKSKLQEVLVCKNENLQKCKSTSYLQNTLSQSQNQATVTDLQWLSSGPRWICCGSYTSEGLQELLGRLPETWRRDHLRNHWQTKKVGCWWQGSGGSMRLHFLGKAKNLLKLLLVKTTNSYYLWKLQTATTCEDYKHLSTIQQAFIKATTVTKDFSKCRPWQLMSIPGIVLNWQSHNSHKRVLKMPLVVAVVSTSWNRILLAFTKPGQSPKASQNATHWNSIYYRDRSNLVVEIHFLEFLRI